MEKRTTIVGTLRSNRRDIPSHAKSVNTREKKSSMYYSSEGQTMLSYYDKGNKPVLLLSTMHTSAENDINGVPEIVNFYNDTKGGTDNMDHMIRLYRSGKVSCRWPLTFFFNMMDVALLKSCIIYRSLQPPSHIKRFRRQFLLDVGYELLDPFIKMRLQSTRNLSTRILNAIKLIGYQLPQHSSRSDRKKRNAVSCVTERKTSKQHGNVICALNMFAKNIHQKLPR